MLVQYTIGGSAVNGDDYNAFSNFVEIPAGAYSTSVAVVAKDDALSEGTETITISLASTAFWDAGPTTNATLTLLDDEPDPPRPTLQISSDGSGRYDLTLTGAASRLYDLEASTDLMSWTTLTT